MRRQTKGRKFSREKDQRNALKKSLMTSLFVFEKIKTTEAKAKDLSGLAEKVITKAKKADVSTRRLLAKQFAPKIVKKLVNEIAPRYKEVKGGYTRITKLNPRQSDGARIAIIELIK